MTPVIPIKRTTLIDFSSPNKKHLTSVLNRPASFHTMRRKKIKERSKTLLTCTEGVLKSFLILWIPFHYATHHKTSFLFMATPYLVIAHS